MSLYEVTEFSTVDQAVRGELLSSNGTVALLNGRHVQLMREVDELCSSTSIEFDSEIVKGGISEDGSFVVCGDIDGTIHFVFVTMELGFHSQKLLEPGNEFAWIGFSSIIQDSCKLLVLSSSNILHIFSNFLINRLAKGLLSRDMQCVREVQCAMCVHRVDLGSIHSSLITTVAPFGHNNDCFVSTSTDASLLSVWHLNERDEIISLDGIDDLLKGVSVTKSCVSTDNSLLVLLLDAAYLTLWLLDMLIIVNHLPHTIVTDCQLVSCGKAQQDLLCCAVNQSLQILTLPKLESVYSVSLGCCSVILPNGFLLEDNVCFATLEEGVWSDDDKTKRISIKQLVQTQPEDKLAKLLSQHKFVDAFHFAVKYNLDTQIVHKKKAEVINNLLCQELTAEKTRDCQLELTNTLNEITDEDFVCELVLSSAYQSPVAMGNLLLYAKNKIENSLSLQIKVCSALHRLVTYKMISNGDYDPVGWRGFLEASLFEEFSGYIQRGLVSMASIIWNKHMVELISEITQEGLMGIFHSVPESVCSDDMGTWLREDMLPCLLSHFPYALEQFTDWISDRAKRLELTEKSNWPANALNLLFIVLSSLTSNRKWAEQLGINASQCIPELKVTVSPCIATLQWFRDQLLDLNYIKEQLELVLPFTEYCKETHETVIFRLLDKLVAAESLSTIVQTRVLAYTDKFSLSLDSLLVNYIKHMLTRVPRLTPDSPWEAKGVAVVKCIGNKKLYVEGCIELLRGVWTYWSSSVEGLVQDCFLIDHPCVDELGKEYKLLKLKRMLFEYGVTDFNYSYSNVAIAWRYARYVLKQKGDTVLEDALKVADSYSLDKSRVYLFHLVNLGMNGKFHVIPDVLCMLEKDVGIEVASKTLCFVLVKLDQRFDKSSDSIDEWRGCVMVGTECLKHLRRVGTMVTEEGELVNELLLILQRLLQLQERFQVFLTRHSLRNKENCKKLIQQKLSKISCNCADQTTLEVGGVSLEGEEASFIRFGSLLGYSQLDLLLRLSNSLVEKNKLEEARKVLSLIDLEVLSDSERGAYVDGLVAIVMRIWQVFNERVEDIRRRDVDWMVSLAMGVVQNCHMDLLLYSVELHSLCCLLKWVWSQCIGDLDADERFSYVIDMNRYKEDGLVLESSLVLPLVLDYCQMRLGHMTSIVNRKSRDSHVTRQSRMAGPAEGEGRGPSCVTQSLVDMFQENSHHKLAIDLCIQSTMASCFVSCLTEPKATPTWLATPNTMQELLNTLTTKVLIARQLDHWYGLALLLLAPVKESEQRIVECRKNIMSSYTKVKVFCNVAADFGILTGSLDLVSGSRFFYRSADWGKRLREYQISFTKAFRGGMVEKKAVLIKMFSYPSIPLEMIEEFCMHFGLHSEDMYLNYLKVIITSWKSDYQDRLTQVIKMVDSEEKVTACLSQLIVNKTSPYDHERVGVLLQLLLSGGERPRLPWSVDRGLRLLECLKRHSRSAPLSSVEKSWIKKWRESVKDSVSEEIRHGNREEACLPFHPLLFDASKVAVTILSTELTRDSLSKLIPICTILEVSPDTVIEEAVCHIVTKSSNDEEQTIQYSDLGYLVSCMEDKGKAVGVARWVATEIRKKDMRESIVALEGAFEIAEKWKNKSNEQIAQKCVLDCKKNLQVAQTELVLHDNSIQGEEFTSLSCQPSQLIMKLYTELTTHGPKVKCVHEIATKIGVICNLNIRKIRLKLAEEWLPLSNIANRDMDITQLSMLEDPTALDRCYNGEEEGEERGEEISLRRLAYLLNLPSEIHETTSYLINWAKTPKIVGGVRSRIRAIQVLFAVSPKSVIESVSGTKVTSIREFTQMLLFVCELEDIHMKTTTEAFQRCNKEGLMRTLWRNHPQEPRAVRLICELCMYYGLHDHMMWNKLLRQLMELHMIHYLRFILKSISALPIIHKIPDIKHLWYEALVTPLKEVSVPPTPYQIEECSKSIKLLNICPFMHDLDIKGLADSFKSIGMMEQTQTCLQLADYINDKCMTTT